jgi:phosphohistidine phosphatase
MGRRLAEQGVEVELIISSPATRAFSTAEAMAEELDYPWDGIVAEEKLYDAAAEGMLTVIEEQDDWIDHLMVVGHNPGLTALTNMLSRSDLENVPTCGVVELAYSVDRWMDIAEARPVQFAFDYPKKQRK